MVALHGMEGMRQNGKDKMIHRLDHPFSVPLQSTDTLLVCL